MICTIHIYINIYILINILYYFIWKNKIRTNMQPLWSRQLWKKTCHGDGAQFFGIQNSPVHLWCLRSLTYSSSLSQCILRRMALKRSVSEGTQDFVVLSKVGEGCSQLRQDRSTLAWKYTPSVTINQDTCLISNMSCDVLALWPVLPHVKFFVKCLSAEGSFPLCLAQNRCAKIVSSYASRVHFYSAPPYWSVRDLLAACSKYDSSSHLPPARDTVSTSLEVKGNQMLLPEGSPLIKTE